MSQPEQVTTSSVILRSTLNATLTTLRQSGKVNESMLKRVLAAQIANGLDKNAEILVLAYLSAYPPSFQEFVPRVLRTPADWVILIDLCRKGRIRKGLGRCIKREIQRSLAGYGEFERTWFPDEIQQMIAVSHPRPSILYTRR